MKGATTDYGGIDLPAFRLSAQQERIWFQPECPGSWQAANTVLLAGKLECAVLQEAIRTVVSRHEILRTVFQRRTGVRTPFQVILDNAGFEWELVETAACESSKEPSPFAVECGPMLRVRLIGDSPGRHVLQLTLPALCTDFRSLQNLVDEIGRAYSSLISGEEIKVETLQYADIVEWQNELLASEESEAGRKFWSDTLQKLDASSTESFSLPFEKKAEQPFCPENLAVKMDSPVLARFHAFSSERGFPAPDLLLAAWQSFLFRLTGRTEVTVNCEFDGRNYEELATALGPLARSVPIRGAAEGASTFIQILQRVSGAVAFSREWQQCFGFDLEKTRDRVSVFSTRLPGFEYGEYGVDETYGGVKFSVVRAEVLSRPFMLKLLCLRRKDELTLEFHYDAGKLERQTVARWSGYFQTFLAAAVDKPDELVSRLPLLQESERRALLVDWNRTRTEFPQDQCVHQLFEAQALRTPGRVAVRCEGRELTYRELNQQANQLAHLLRRLGVGPDARVGLCLERSVEMLVGVIGILKAGGAYVPLSPDHPPARLGQQLAGATALLSERKLQARLPVFSGPVIVLDDSREESRENPAPVTEPDNLVYVIYTSGSTGIPKGVGVRHRNLVNYAHFMTRFLELERWPEGLQFATVSPLTADLGNTCIYPALISGGSVHVIGQEMAIDSRELGRYLEACGVDVLKIAPSHLRALLDAGGGKAVLPRKFLVTGGEMLSRELLERVRSVGAECEVVNHYGPTETTIGSLAMRIGERTFHTTGIPIGRPIANTRIYILDAHGEPVPPGVAGELYVAGAGVSAGYVDQPEQTGKSFLPDRCGEGAMYRTGDLARYQADGNVEFLGRVDEQVKIRGYRIEPGEIEAALGRHPAVREAAVVAREGGEVAGGDKRLVAYVVGRRERVVEPEQLRHYLQEQLPDYMIPAAILVLAKLPLNANGKLDRSALPTPEQAASDRPVYEAPRTPREQAIARIWSEVLRRDSIGRLDNFFYIGGHSLLATQVISRMRRVLEREVPLRMLFESPTIAGLAQRIDSASAVELCPTAPPMERVPRDTDLPLSYAQQRLWILDQIDPQTPLYNVPRAWRLRGLLDVEILARSLNEIVRRHESQRTTFALRGGHPVQVIAPDVTITLAVTDISYLRTGDSENYARRLAGEDAQRPFDLQQGPLLRARLFRLKADDHILLLTVHHIVSDAWSAGIFLKELGAVYSAFLQGSPSPLPEPAVQYADYAVWQRRWLQGEVLQRQLDYWRRQLAGAPPMLALPIDHPHPERPSFRGACERMFLTGSLTHALRQLSATEGATLFMTLLAGFNALLGRYTGEQQIVVGTDAANRGTSETEQLIGFFVNILPLRVDLSGNPTFRELLRRVRETALGAYAHQDVPFDKLVEELQPERNSSHSPIVQVLFVLQNVPRPERAFAGLELSGFEIPVTRSKFDLAVFIAEGAEGLVAYWLYGADLFERGTILRMARGFEAMLTRAAAGPDTRLNALDPLKDEEKLEHEAAVKHRKRSQMEKLMAVEPECVGLSEVRVAG